MALDEELVTAALKIIHEMMTMSKDMLSMLKATIEVVNRHQEQLVFLHHQNSLTEQKKKEVKGKGKDLQKCSHCGRKHSEEDCPMINQTCFRCHQYGHFVAACPLKIQGKPIQAEPSSKSSGFKRSYIYDEEDGRMPKNFRHAWD